ncbi:MAG: GIY-YIG nuclease family protein [Bacillales bacterium]|nr:GIY-YIG nuclease family protein [Bacillales bacterium]
MARANEHYFYVLKCSDGSFYGGYTTDVQRRVRQHNDGKGAKYTRSRGPVKLIYMEGYETKGEALRAEHRFKMLTRKQKEKFLGWAGDRDD